MILLTVACEPPMGVAWIKWPVMESVLDRQVSVKDVSFTSEMRTRRGGLISASRGKENAYKAEQRWRLIEMRLPLAQPVTVQRSRLSLQRSAGDRILQSIDLDLVAGCHL